MENIDGWERFCLWHPYLVQTCKIIYGDTDLNYIMEIGEQMTKGMQWHHTLKLWSHLS